jgi:cytidine deaminase
MPDDKKHIAFITDSNGNIISIGINKYAHPYGSIHAEDAAIRYLIHQVSRGKFKERKLRRLTMYVFCIGADLKMSKPCLACQDLLQEYSSWFHRVYYSTGNPDNVLEEFNLKNLT